MVTVRQPKMDHKKQKKNGTNFKFLDFWRRARCDATTYTVFSPKQFWNS